MSSCLSISTFIGVTFPGGHKRQSLSPAVGLYLPPPQVVHLEAPLRDVWPAAQDKHLLLESWSTLKKDGGNAVPASHFVQLLAPFVMEYLPLEQTAHELEPTFGADVPF